MVGKAMMEASEAYLRCILENEGIEDEEVLKNTPRRWVSALRALLGSDGKDFDFTVFPSIADDMVIVQDIQFASLCAHHLLPFFGQAHVAYIPQGYIAGLSKLARVVRATALGLWTQEELADEISTTLQRNLDPKGVAVVLRAEHTCMSVRGVRAPGALTTTSSMRGVFRDDKNNARAEFLSLIK
jgi:GTP cyclohydrolase I